MADIFFIKRPLEGGTLKFLRRKLNRWYNCVLTTAADKTIEWDAALAIPYTSYWGLEMHVHSPGDYG